MSSGGDEFRSSPNMISSTVSSTIMLTNNNSTNDMNSLNGAVTGENGCGGLVVIKQEPSALQDFKSITTNYCSNNVTEGCNMLQKVPSLSDLSDPENSLGKYQYYIIFTKCLVAAYANKTGFLISCSLSDKNFNFFF